MKDIDEEEFEYICKQSKKVLIGMLILLVILILSCLV